jgi:Holliday junction DNA helicase RuvB
LRRRSSAASRSITVLLHGPPGLGKTTLASVIANELGVQFARPRGRRSKSRATWSASSPTSRPAVLFIDEIHRMSPAVEEILYPALEDYEVDIVIGQGPSARTVKMRLERFHADRRDDADRAADVAARSPFGISHRLEFYTPADLERSSAARRRSSARRLSSRRRRKSRAGRAARRRIANRLLRRVRDYARMRATHDHPRRLPRGTQAARGRRARLRRDRPQAAAHDHRQVRRRPGRPRHDCRRHQLKKDAIEDIYEPFLLQNGFIDRTPRGRRRRAPTAYFGLVAPAEQRRDSRLW